MAKTRSKGPAKTSASKDEAAEQTTAGPSLPASVSNPPKLFILPKDVSPEARIVTIPNPATASQTRYCCCPKKGFYEFTRIAAPKSSPRSWLLSPERKEKDEPSAEINAANHDLPAARDEAPPNPDGDASDPLAKGYTMKSADVFVATPLDALFLVLPALALSSKDQKQMFVSIDDHLDSLSSSSAHLKQLLYNNSVKSKLEERMAAVCDTVDAGDEKMYRLSMDRLVKELLAKAERLAANGLPPSMEERFIRKTLEVPVMNIKREESTISAVLGEGADGESPIKNTDSQTTSEATTNSQTSAESQSTAATSVSGTSDIVKVAPAANSAINAPDGVPRLLRIRTAIDFMSTSYLPSTLRPLVKSVLKSTTLVDFAPLDAHLDHLSSLRSQVQALRSLSDNISRKRGVDDDEAAEARAEKKRKKEEEEAKKKNQSRGVKQLSKVDTSGMKKLSAFFTKAPAKK